VIQMGNGTSSSSHARARPGASSVDAEAGTVAVVRALFATRGGRRDFVPIARSFLQRRQAGGGAAPLSWFVKARRGRALDLYLLAHALASTDPYDVALSARKWAVALGLPDTLSSRVFISATWTWLEDHALIRTERDGRMRRVWLLSESGSGEPYRHGGSHRQLDYFKLPYAYWIDGWSEQLDLPATAVLLIALSLPSTFVLPQHRGAEWYGLSRDTLRRGLRTLSSHGLLATQVTLRAAPRSPTGATEQRRYKLTGPFARKRAGRAPAKRAAAP
jgi:hypothetical protein